VQVGFRGEPREHAWRGDCEACRQFDSACATKVNLGGGRSIKILPYLENPVVPAARIAEFSVFNRWRGTREVTVSWARVAAR